MCGIELLRGPALQTRKVVEGLTKLGSIDAGPDVVAIPLQGLGQLNVAEPGAFEAVAHGAAEGFAGVAAEAELGVAIHGRNVGHDGENSVPRAQPSCPLEY
jgi:hypothetical protein